MPVIYLAFQVESQFKASEREGTSKWLQHTPSPPPVFTNPTNKYPGTDTSTSYQHYTSIHNPQPTIDYSSMHKDPKIRQYPTYDRSARHRVPTTNYQSAGETSTSVNHQQHFLHSDPKHYSTAHTSITAPHSPGYKGDKGYLMSGVGVDVGAEVTRPGLDFVPLKTVQDDHDTDSVISGLNDSPGGRTFQDMGYQQKV